MPVDFTFHYRTPVGVPEISQHLVRLMGRDQARGIFISASDFSDPAVRVARDFLQQKVLALCHIEEIVAVFEREVDLPDFLNQKVRAAIVHKNPYFRPLDPKVGA